MTIGTEIWQGQFDKLFIGGDWVPAHTAHRLEVVCPSTELIIASVPEALEPDIDAAVTSARRAFDSGPWPKLPLADRLVVLKRLSDLLREHEATIAHLVTAEMGSPISTSRSMQAQGPRILLDTFIEIAPDYPWSTVSRHSTGNALVTRVPAGVVAAIVPWNAPLLTTMIKIAPALISGCSVVLKPAPETPLDAYLLAELLDRAGLPKGVFNVVPAQRQASEYLVRHAGIDKVSFTGSTDAGRHIASICGADVKRLTLELGGKSAAVILGDADLDLVIDSVRRLSLRNSGQACSNKTRLVVDRKLRDELHDRLLAMVKTMPVGDPFDPSTEIGPLAGQHHRARVEAYVAGAIADGETLLVGGDRPAGFDKGYYVSPTIFADVAPDAKIAQEEIFGPVLTIHTFDTDEEAAAIANNSKYGLNGSVFAADPMRALSLAKSIRTGTVEINGQGAGFKVPIGGFKHSGIGRESGFAGLDSYIEHKSYGITSSLADALGQD